MKPESHFRRGVFAVVLGATLLGGCASTGNLHSVGTPTDPASLHSQHSLAGVRIDPATWPRHAWWKSVHDVQLDRLIAEALAGNPDMALVDARVRAALAQAGAADAARKPTLNGGASAAGARIPPLLPPIADGHWGVIRYGYLSFKWDVDLWGGKRAAWEAAVGTAHAAAVDAEAARLRLSADVAQAYFNLGAAYVLRDLAHEELRRAEDFQKLTRQRVANGIENRLPLAQIDSEVAGDRAHLDAADNGVRVGGLVLAALLGKGPDRALTITRPALPAVPALALPSDLPAELLGRRPDVVAARWRVEAASRDIRAAKARFLPDLGISSLAGLIAPSSLDLFSLSNRFYTVAPAVSLPIFEGGALRANLAGKDAARDEAIAEYNQTLVRAINQVATQVDDLRSLASQVRAAESARASAEHGYALAMQRFHAGIGNFLESLTERQQLIAAEQQLAAVRSSRVDAWVQLNEALGGGFVPSAADANVAAATNAPHAGPKANP
ncbi:MAG TPA: efflux transporter outer membrane subunit [Rhodanobacteraceae bacterium]|nr:efflux transporter outer membrane subunit [Rhodanobacteraceae bacterium]